MNTHCDDTGMRRAEARARANLSALGYRLRKCRRTGGFVIYQWSEDLRQWVEHDGLTPIPYSLSLQDVVETVTELLEEAEEEPEP